MAKKPSLNAALNQAAGKEPPAPKPEPKLEETTQPAPLQQRTPARHGKKMVGGHFDPAVAKALKVMAAEQEKTIQELLEEAVGDLMEKYGKPRLT
jgi:hypothetical protein